MMKFSDCLNCREITMDEDYEICVKEMRGIFEQPRKVGVLPRTVKVRKNEENVLSLPKINAKLSAAISLNAGGVSRKSYQTSECSTDDVMSTSASSDDVLSSSAASDVDILDQKDVTVCYKGPYIEQEEEQEVLCNINNAFLTKKKLTQAEQMLKLLQQAEADMIESQSELDKRVDEK
jgi:hypothetical protein